MCYYYSHLITHANIWHYDGHERLWGIRKRDHQKFRRGSHQLLGVSIRGNGILGRWRGLIYWETRSTKAVFKILKKTLQMMQVTPSSDKHKTMLYRLGHNYIKDIEIASSSELEVFQ